MDRDASKFHAQQVTQAIESFCNENTVGLNAEELRRSLGGTVNLSDMPPATAALYLVALLIRGI